MVNVLLVEPYYRRRLVPLGLMKISSYHKSKGDNVQYIRGYDWFVKLNKPDIIYITSLFSWDYDIVINTIKYYQKKYPDAEIKVGGCMATIMKDDIYRDTGIMPHQGLLEEVENCIPDYSIFPNINYVLGYTSRGCIRKCPWCIVWRMEKFQEINDWDKYVLVNHLGKRIYLLDNNFFACSYEHIKNVLARLSKKDISRYEFNQGLDCRLFTEDIAKLFYRTKINPIIFGFDTLGVEKDFREAVKLCHKYKIKTINAYVLFNTDYDKPEDLWYRLKVVWELGAGAYPMRFQPLDTKKQDSYISKNWTKEELLGVKRMKFTIFKAEIWGRQDKNFLNKIGKNEQEFKERIRKLGMGVDIYEI